jgi:hypothetical protein
MFPALAKCAGLAVVVALLLPSTGCVPLAVLAIRNNKQSARIQEIRAQVEPLMGRSKEDVVVAIGPPTRVFEQGEVTVFRYVWIGSAHSFAAGGATAQASCYGYGCSGTSSGVAGGTAWQDSDQIDVTFRGGVAISWRANVMR